MPNYYHTLFDLVTRLPAIYSVLKWLLILIIFTAMQSQKPLATSTTTAESRRRIYSRMSAGSWQLDEYIVR